MLGDWPGRRVLMSVDRPGRPSYVESSESLKITVNFGTWSCGGSIYLCIALGKGQTAAGTPCPLSFDQEPKWPGWE